MKRFGIILALVFSSSALADEKVKPIPAPASTVSDDLSEAEVHDVAAVNALAERVQDKAERIAALQEALALLKDKLASEQDRVAKSIVARHKMGPKDSISPDGRHVVRNK